ncbi:MAG TPA: helix-turn-helix transcriptional regulator [Streptosporangiaceae bacterium]|nr:helix-turn-helix transcriptional regulator [Streptosporangiaceae bacterium]
MSTVQRDGQPAADAQGPTVPRMLVGIELHRYREAAGITPDQAAYEIRASRSKISRMENGLVRFKERDVTDLLTLYGITDEQIRGRLVTLARQASMPGWWSKYGDIMADWFESYLGLETAASVIRTFELQFVHGLFQTEDYARAVTLLGHTGSPGDEIDRRVSLRLKRQDLLTSPHPPQVWSVLDEGALRRPVGGRQVMRAQLSHLAEAARMRHVTLQVVPFDRGGHAAAGGSFTVLRFSEPEVPDVVYLEQLTSALYLDKHEDVDHYMEVMNHLSTEALTPVESTRFITDMSREI